MNIHDVVSLSGLSRKQIDAAINRWAITPHCKKINLGASREFTAADVFNFCIAGELHRLGLSWPAIREAVWAATVMQQVDPETFEQIEIFPGASRFAEAVLLIRNFDPDGLPEATFIERDDLVKVAGDAAIILPASKIANRIVAETETSAR